MHQPSLGEPDDKRDYSAPLRRYQLYATSIKALLDWPHGFHRFLDAYLSRRERSLSYRIDDDFDYIFTRCIRIYWNHDDFQVIHQAFDNYLIDNYAVSGSLIHLDRSSFSPDFRERLPYITVSAAAKMLGITPESLLNLAQEQGKIAWQKAKGGEHNFTLVKRDEVLDLKKKWEEGVSMREAAEELGTSPKIIRQLIRRKKLRAVRGLEEDGSHTWLINHDSLQSFRLQLRFRTRRPVPGKMIPIVTAAQMLSAYRVKMAHIILSILSSELSAYWAKEAEKLDEILVLQADIDLMLNHLSARKPLLTRHKIAQRMRVKLETVTAWVKKGFIVPLEQKQNFMSFSRAAVKRFEHEFISTEAAARVLQINELTVQNWTRKGRLKPVSGPGIDDRAAYLFHRQEIEHLRPENRCSAPEMATRLGMSRSQLIMWIAQGKVTPISGPGIDQCGRYLFALDETRGQ